MRRREEKINEGREKERREGEGRHHRKHL